MTATIDDLRDALEGDFHCARERLLEARSRQQRKDSPPNRAAVAECWTRMDTVLDTYLELRRVAGARPPADRMVTCRSSSPATR